MLQNARDRVEEVLVLAIIGVVLLVLWLLGFIAFHVTTSAVHILLAIAVVMIILHFVRGRSTTV
jgi:membrane-bound ClpP family serine protease